MTAPVTLLWGATYAHLYFLPLLAGAVGPAGRVNVAFGVRDVALQASQSPYLRFHSCHNRYYAQ